MKQNKIHFNQPFIIDKEIENILNAIKKHKKLSGDGQYTQKCQNWLENQLNIPKVLLTHSCTAALEMSAILANIGTGDEVIMPSFTFVSTANAFVLRSATPVFVDICNDTLNINPKKIERAITSSTKAIVVVHYAGIACAMDEIKDIATRHNLVLIEDAAQAIISSYKNKYLGTIGDLSTFSFHETKNIISGEGGALCINNEKYIERAEIIWEKGTNRRKFFQGEVDKYTWVDIGSSFLPSELVAAFLYSQLENSKIIIQRRLEIYQQYYNGLKDLEIRGYLKLPIVPQECIGNGHIFYILTRSTTERSALIEHLQKSNIYAVFHYIPLHLSPAGQKYTKTSGSLEITENISKRLLRLPLYYEITKGEVEKVICEVYHFFKVYREK